MLSTSPLYRGLNAEYDPQQSGYFRFQIIKLKIKASFYFKSIWNIENSSDLLKHILNINF